MYFHIHFYTKNLLFLFYTFIFTKHPHKFIYSITSFIIIINFLNFFLLFPSTNPFTYVRSLSLYPFFLICCSLSLPISIPIFESTLPLGLIHTISVTSIDLPSSNPQAPISLAPIHKHQSDPTRSDLTEISLASIHKHLSVSVSP